MNERRETLLKFPCSFPLKVIGKDENDFEMFVVSIVRKHVPLVKKSDVANRSSDSGKYLAVTITFVAESKEQIDALYEELQAHERVIVVL
jgi:putative lipoic acid-binding regulatory protein